MVGARDGTGPLEPAGAARGGRAPAEGAGPRRRPRAGTPAGPPSFDEIYRRYARRVLGVARSVVNDAHEAEDAAQDAFLRIYRSLGSVADPGKLEAWLVAVTRNAARDRARRMLRLRPTERAHDDGSDERPGGPRVVHRSGDVPVPPAASAIVRDTLREMPRPLRSVLRLRYARGLTCREIAHRERVSLSCVKTRLHRARRKLEQALVAPREPAREAARGAPRQPSPPAGGRCGEPRDT